ncbi:coiled-coil domain-containing protein 15 [Cyclopterus lumpus]|uniref:coiled-coil domain-containing protein 15 n=1 Tax=Cyclopterus lumpus TaxID=8103 RepID=UPI0014874A3D|nr:coiled-coil domain-containing protein 15 [Cyclopterus lumpus]
MSASRRVTSTSGRCKASVSRSKEHPAPRGASKVLAERNQAVVAVGAWVEGGQDSVEHPWALASLTEEIQSEKRRETEEGLQRFQDEVRHRVAQQAQVSKKRQQHQKDSMVKPDRRTPQQQHQVRTQHVSAGERPMSAGGAAQQRVTERSTHQSRGGVRQVRLRLAACRMVPHGEMMSDLSGGEWNISPSRHKAGTSVLKPDQEVEEQHQEEEEEDEEEDVQEEEEEEDDYLFTSQHECPLVQQKVNGPMLWDSEKSQPPAFKSIVRVPQALWPLTDQEELKRQHQSQFLMHRRLYMNIEREQVKENKRNRKHLKRTSRFKAEKEQIRLEEERKLDRVRWLAEARQKLEERELLIQERLKLEEEERAVQLQRRKREEKGKVASRFIEALRAQLKERLSQEKPEKPEPPPLCCCASSFWDSHPDTCANNCVFYNNPKAYAKALRSTMLSLELQ